MSTASAADEPQRLSELRQYGVAGMPRDSVLEDIVALVARVCETPIALVALVGTKEQWLIASLGAAGGEARSSLALNAFVVSHPGVLTVDDLAADLRFAVTSAPDADSAAAAPRFYAGAQLVTPSGAIIGVLAVMDIVPRTLTHSQQSGLQTIAAVVMTRLDLRKQQLDTVRAERALLDLLRDQQQLSTTLRSNDSRYRMLFSQNPTPMWVFDTESLRFLAVNAAAVEHYGYSEAAFLSMTIADIRDTTEMSALLDAIARFPLGKRQITLTRHRLSDGRSIDVEVSGDTITFDDRPARLVVATDVTARLAAEQQRHESEERFAMVVQASTAGMWDWNIRTDSIYVSPGFRQLLGLAGDEYPKNFHAILGVMHPDDCVSTERILRDHLAAPGSTFDADYRLRTADGSYRWINARGQAVWDSNGRPYRMTGTVVDVTERRQAADALRESEERFRLLSRATNDAIWDWDLSTDLLWWNDGFFALFGYARTDATPDIETWRRRIYEPDRARIVAGLQEAIHSGAESWWGEYRFEKADGSQAYVLDRGYIIRDAAGVATRMIGGMTDLTARREAEEQIAAQAALLNEAQDAILLTDLSNRVLFWNRGAERLYGWSAGEAIGRDTVQLHQIDSVAYREANAGVLAHGRWEGSLAHRTSAGDVLTVETRLALTRDGTGKPKAILILSTDVTERKRTEAHFLRAQRMESIGTLAGGIAHDLNNLLAPMMLSVDLLRDSCNDTKSLELLNTLQLSAARGASLVQQVLSFARGVEGQRVPVGPVLLVREVQKIIRESFPKTIRVVVPPAEDIWSVQGDPTQLHQVLLNLSVNARDAMPNGGVLTITLENRELDAVHAAPIPEGSPEGHPDAKFGDYVIIRVADTGSGVSAQVRERIFEPFFSTKAVGQGTGLGLSTTLAIVRSHGGFITLESEVDVGTTFSVFLPASRADRAVMHTPTTVHAIPRGNGELVLIVDDEAPIRHISQRTLERFGYQVLTAANGAEALAIYTQRGSDIDIVLTDMAMPIMDGPTLMLALRAINPNVRIIASSGLTADESIDRGSGEVRTGFLPKPYTASTLVQAIQDAL